MNNRFFSLRKTVLAIALMGGLNTVTQAGEPGSMYAPVTFEPVRDDQAISVGIGAVFGALLGGPAGLVIGMVGMNAMDDYQHRQQQQAALATDTEFESGPSADSPVQTESLAAFETSDEDVTQLAALAQRSARHPDSYLSQALASHFEQWIQFRTGKSELEPHLYQQLARSAAWMNQMPSVQIELHGFTDPRGNDQDNLALSRARLDSVRRALIEGGLDQARITGFAHGESQPLYSGNDAEGNDFERRVLISFQLQGQPS